MKLHRLLTYSLSAVILCALALAVSVPAYAGPITVNWTDWYNNDNTVWGNFGGTAGPANQGSAYGQMDGISVNYYGATPGLSYMPTGSSFTWSAPATGSNGVAYPGSGLPPNTQPGSLTWNGPTPTSSTSTTFTSLSGIQNIANAPPTSYNSLAIVGGDAVDQEEITFTSGLYGSGNSVEVTDPLMAIWSLGELNKSAEFDFNQPFIVIAGGPDQYSGGQALGTSNCTGPSGECYTVNGNEGSGVIEFIGTFDEISFTTPVAENYYAFTLGEEGVIPEPETLSLFGLGLLALPLLRASLASRRRA